MRYSLFLPACALLVALTAAQAPHDPYAPLRLYEGAWNSTGQRDGKPTHDHIVNVCRQLGLYFACEQTVNGKVGSLVIYVPTATPGQYHLQAVLPQGFAIGRSDLTIAGELWTYSSKGEVNGRTIFYRTTNRFHGPGQIHYELQESPDGQHWTTTGSGDEVHLSTPSPAALKQFQSGRSPADRTACGFSSRKAASSSPEAGYSESGTALK